MAEQSKFKIGDVVMLKSGGPTMTVDEVAEWGDGDGFLSARCVWFDATNMPQERVYRVDVLRAVSEDEGMPIVVTRGEDGPRRSSF